MSNGKQKVPKPNGFMMFVLERKKELEKDGEQFSGIADAVDKLGQAWKTMSKDERAPYEKKAKERKERSQETQQARRAQIYAPLYGCPAGYTEANGMQPSSSGNPG